MMFLQPLTQGLPHLIKNI
ncbi:hypothetical protein M8C21_018524, partial [Ambrosia artemisiifolia]